MGNVTRKIYFFQIEWVKENGEKIQKDLNFIDSIMDSILGTYSRKILDVGDDVIFIEKCGTASNSSLWKMEKIRKDDLSLKFDEQQLKEEPLNLGPHEGLAEPSHFVIFAGKIMGAEYNHHGARWINSKLARIINDYLSQNPVGGIVRVEIKPIFKRELYKVLDRLVEIRGITIKIATNYAKLLINEDPESFGKMFSAAELIDGVWLTLSFTIGSRKHIEKSKFEKIMESIRKLLGRSEAAENLKIMEIRGKLEGSDSVERLNLLEEMLVSEKRVARLDERSRAADSKSMFKEIIDSYHGFQDELREYVRGY